MSIKNTHFILLTECASSLLSTTARSVTSALTIRQVFFQKSLQSQTYPIVRIWTARATARGPHLNDVIGRLEVGVGTSSWGWGLMGIPKFDKHKFDNFPQNLKLEVTFWHWASNLTHELIFGGTGWLLEFFSKVHLLTKWTQFAKSPCSDIDLDFHSLFSTKGPFFVFQIDLWIF